MPRAPRWLVKNVVALGVVSLLTDASSEMVIPLLPLFLTTVLKASAVQLGGIEGAAEATAALLKLWSGWMGDRTGRKRPLVLAGYTVSTLARPLVAITASPFQVLLVRMSDRVGKGIRSSPRDAMLAASIDPADRGAAFGFHQAMDHVGAVVGPLIAVLVLQVWPGDYRRLFALAAIPGALAVLAVLAGVDDADVPLKGPAVSFERPDAALVRILVPVGVFALGNASDTFLLLKAGGVEASATSLPLLWMAFHVVKAVFSTPAGALSDRIGRRPTIAIGWLVYAAVYAGFAYATSPFAFAALFVVYGLFHAFTEGAEKALVAEVVPEARRGAAFGWYYLVVGLIALPASLLFGAVWEAVTPRAAFGMGAVLAMLALVLLAILAPRRTIPA
jgi:MFS family permease